jgi:hypothetical protein
MCLYLKTHKIIVKGYIALLARNSMGIIIPDYDIEKVKLIIYICGAFFSKSRETTSFFFLQFY